MAAIPHPPVEESMKLFADRAGKIIFTHLNHTNPLLDPSSDECGQLRRAGFRIAEDGGEIV
jgi:pyrroloquinoline quinone biosynthesis protein B